MSSVCSFGLRINYLLLQYLNVLPKQIKDYCFRTLDLQEMYFVVRLLLVRALRFSGSQKQ